MTHLTPREVQILQLLCRGDKRLAIAGALEITPRTVNFHLTNAKRKLGAISMAQAIYHFAALPKLTGSTIIQAELQFSTMTEN